MHNWRKLKFKNSEESKIESQGSLNSNNSKVSKSSTEQYIDKILVTQTTDMFNDD